MSEKLPPDLDKLREAVEERMKAHRDFMLENAVAWLVLASGLPRPQARVVVDRAWERMHGEGDPGV